MNDLPTLYDLVLGSATRSGWLLEYDLLSPAQGVNATQDAQYYANLQVSRHLIVGEQSTLLTLSALPRQTYSRRVPQTMPLPLSTSGSSFCRR